MTKRYVKKESRTIRFCDLDIGDFFCKVDPDANYAPYLYMVVDDEEGTTKAVSLDDGEFEYDYSPDFEVYQVDLDIQFHKI